MNACCSGLGLSTLPSPSSVVIARPSTAVTGSTHERTAAPSRWTVQAPHCERPQPNLGPCNPSWSRSTYSSIVSGSACTECCLPFILRWMVVGMTRSRSDGADIRHALQVEGALAAAAGTWRTASLRLIHPVSNPGRVPTPPRMLVDDVCEEATRELKPLSIATGLRHGSADRAPVRRWRGTRRSSLNLSKWSLMSRPSVVSAATRFQERSCRLAWRLLGCSPGLGAEAASRRRLRGDAKARSRVAAVSNTLTASAPGGALGEFTTGMPEPARQVGCAARTNALSDRVDVSLNLERAEDRARSGLPFGALPCQSAQTFAGALQVGYLPVELHDPARGQFACPVMVVACVQIEQFLDFVEREAGPLRVADEPQPPDVRIAITPDAVAPLRRFEQFLALVEPDGFDADAPCVSQFSDGQHLCLLTPYHGTELTMCSDPPGFKRKGDIGMPEHPANATVAKTARLYRMRMPQHTCPYGLKALALLKRSDYAVEDHLLTSREQTETFKAQHGVATT